MYSAEYVETADSIIQDRLDFINLKYPSFFSVIIEIDLAFNVYIMCVNNISCSCSALTQQATDDADKSALIEMDLTQEDFNSIISELVDWKFLFALKIAWANELEVEGEMAIQLNISKK